jgi:hypothetical protein
VFLEEIDVAPIAAQRVEALVAGDLEELPD